jgi:HlyD family secretion protein
MKRVFGIAAVLIVAAAITGAVYMRSKAAGTTPVSNVSTAAVQRGSLAASVNAAGNITAHQQADLSFGQSATVKTINVKVGDRIKAGQVLAEQDTSDLALQLRNAEVSLKVAQAKYAQAKNPNTEQDIATARAQLESAQAAFDKLKAGPSQADLASSQAQVASAQAAYDAAVKSAGTTSSSAASTAAAFEKARIALEKAQGDYDKVSWRGDVAASSQAQALQSATIDYEQARAAYDAQAATAASSANSSLAQARSQLQQAQSNLSKLQNQVTAADVAASQAQLTQAKNNLDKLLAGPDANSLDIAQSGVDQAQISLDQAKLKLAQAQIVAPFDGVVTQVNIKLGQNASSASAIQIADLDNLEIVVNMAEVDVNRAKVGQEAVVTLDAVPDVTLQGTVSLIAPAGVMSQGVVNYPVTIALKNPPAGVKTGMTANLNIIVDQRDNVLTVPNRAVRTQGRQKVVTVLFEGQNIQVPVQTGLSNDTSTEIVSGLKEGDEVVLTSTTTQNRGGAFIGGPGGAGFGGPPPGR